MAMIDVIILAAGRATRCGVAKQYADLCGTPVIVRALRPFERLPYVGRKYITVRQDDADLAFRILNEHQISNFELVIGGETRQESVYRALHRVGTERVITHNAALPFVTEGLIDRVASEEYPCVTTVTPLQVNICRGKEFAEQLIDRDSLQVINTPQSFHAATFFECHRRALEDHLVVASDCELMMHYGHRVRFVPGIPENFKLTTALDMILAESLARLQCEHTR